MKSKLTLPSYKSPLSMAISQSCGGRGWRLSCLSDGSFWECLSLVPVSQKSWFVFFLFFFEKCPLYTCRLRNIELQTQEAATQVKKFSAFLCMRRCKSQGSFKWFPWYVPHLSGDRAPVFSLTSGFTIGSDCSLFAFLGAHWLMLKGCNHWFHFSGLSSWSWIWPIFGKHFLINFCPMVLRGSSQIRQKCLIHHTSW